MNADLTDLRRSYHRDDLLESEVHPDPIAQFRRWFAEAAGAGLIEPNAMTLATATPDGRPSARIVLLKGFDEHGFVFFTNYESRKGQELTHNPWAALVFWWDRLERQVRIEGRVEKVDESTSDAYFQSRPRGSRLGALASAQSRVVPHRGVLEDALASLEAGYDDGEIPRPPHWGGYRLEPVALEFWQGRVNRLHDRLRYRREAGGWLLERLSP